MSDPDAFACSKMWWHPIWLEHKVVTMKLEWHRWDLRSSNHHLHHLKCCKQGRDPVAYPCGWAWHAGSASIHLYLDLLCPLAEGCDPEPTLGWRGIHPRWLGGQTAVEK